jgi:uncharacterized protein YciI
MQCERERRKEKRKEGGRKRDEEKERARKKEMENLVLVKEKNTLLSDGRKVDRDHMGA